MPSRRDDHPAMPAPRHAMRLLAPECEQSVDGDLRGWIAVTPANAAPSGGARLAAVAMLVDALGGLRSISAAAPDWSFTADLSIHLVPTGPVPRLDADVHVRRRGRRTLVVEAELHAGGAPAGLATLTFAVVPRPDHLLDVVIDTTPGHRVMAALDPDQPPAGPYLEELGVVVDAPGRVSVALRPEVQNTVGALHGAVHTALVDEAAVSLGRHLLGPAAETTDVHLAFLELARTGPVRATAEVVGDDAATDRLTAEVRVVEADGRLCSYATVEVVA